MFIVLLCLLDHQINNFNSMIYQFLIMLHFTCTVHFFIFNDHFVIMSDWTESHSHGSLCVQEESYYL